MSDLSTTDSLFGISYMTVADFKTRARMLGCARAITGWTEPELAALLTEASRRLDAHCARNFLPDQIQENHYFDLATRRTQINYPPVLELIEFKIQVAPQSYATFPLNSVVINNQEGYLELAALAVATTLAPTVISLGISEPQAYITYRSYQSVPAQVMAATGHIAAQAANEAYLAQIMTPGLSSVEDGEQSYEKAEPASTEAELPAKAILLLEKYCRAIAG